MWISKEKHQELIDKYNKLSLEHYNVGANFTQMYNKNIKLELEIKRLTEENTRLGRTNNELANQYKDAYKRIQELESKTKIHIIYVPEPLPEKQKEEKIVIEPTYFTMNENRQCFDLCEIINDGTKIGSRFCCECNSCKAFNDEKKWVQCSERPDGKIKKRDKFGVISEIEDNSCNLCVYKEDNIKNKVVCDNCSNVNDFNEYYSSK
jgi:hypothetical protein